MDTVNYTYIVHQVLPRSAWEEAYNTSKSDTLAQCGLRPQTPSYFRLPLVPVLYYNISQWTNFIRRVLQLFLLFLKLGHLGFFHGSLFQLFRINFYLIGSFILFAIANLNCWIIAFSHCETISIKGSKKITTTTTTTTAGREIGVDCYRTVSHECRR